MESNMIYITARDIQEAEKIGKEIVELRLAACVNIIPGMNSFYWWEGKVQESSEVIIIAKTKKNLVKDLVSKVKSMHSYVCPCIVSLPILEGNDAFLKWIQDETL